MGVWVLLYYQCHHFYHSSLLHRVCPQEGGTEGCVGHPGWSKSTYQGTHGRRMCRVGVLCPRRVCILCVCVCVCACGYVGFVDSGRSGCGGKCAYERACSLFLD